MIKYERWKVAINDDSVIYNLVLTLDRLYKQITWSEDHTLYYCFKHGVIIAIARKPAWKYIGQSRHENILLLLWYHVSLFPKKMYTIYTDVTEVGNRGDGREREPWR